MLHSGFVIQYFDPFLPIFSLFLQSYYAGSLCCAATFESSHFENKWDSMQYNIFIMYAKL